MQNTISFNPNGHSNVGDGTLNKVPIKRNNLFFSDADFQFEQRIGQEYLAQDMNMSVVLYRVDISNTNLDDIYHESGKHKVQFKTPMELSCSYELKEAELKAYDKQGNKGVYQQLGVLEVYIYQSELDYKDVEVTKGDYIGVQVTPERMEFFSVFDDGKVNYANSQTMYGTQPFWRKIRCAPVDANEFDGM